jgi:hypothetical protein
MFHVILIAHSSSRNTVFLHPTPISRHVLDPVVLQTPNDFWIKCSGHLNCVRAWHIFSQALPFGYPAGLGVVEGDQAFEDLRGTFEDDVFVLSEQQDGFAVWAAAVEEFLVRDVRDVFDVK